MSCSDANHVPWSVVICGANRIDVGSLYIGAVGIFRRLLLLCWGLHALVLGTAKHGQLFCAGCPCALLRIMSFPIIIIYKTTKPFVRLEHELVVLRRSNLLAVP
jgi:hypothetical protein